MFEDKAKHNLYKLTLSNIVYLFNLTVSLMAQGLSEDLCSCNVGSTLCKGYRSRKWTQ